MARKLFWHRNRSDDQGVGQGADAPEESDADEAAPTDASDISNKDAFSEPSSVSADQQDTPQRPLSPDDRLKARSLIAAWRVGATWSPSWHRSWLKEHQSEGDKSKPGDSVIHPKDKTICASIVRDMLDDPEHTPKTFDEAPLKVTNTGARLEDCTINGGELDLTALKFEKPIRFLNCTFVHKLILREARLGSLCLDRCNFLSIDAKNMRAEGEVSIESAEVAYGTDFLRADIGGLLNFQDTKFNAKKGENYALQCNGARVGGPVWLRNGFEADGKVDLGASIIGGGLECQGGKFRNPGKTALSGNAATVRSMTFLCGEFSVDGKVDFVGATLKGGIDCSGGSFKNLGYQTALSLYVASIEGDVLLNKQFVAEGGVSLRGATIGGQIICSKGTFCNPKVEGNDQTGVALDCGAATINGDVFLSTDFRAKGTVTLVGATLKRTLNCAGGSFECPDEVALDCNRAKIESSVYLRDKFNAKGEVNFVGATIGGQMSCSNASFENQVELGRALACNAVTVGSDVIFDKKTSVVGSVTFVRANIGGDLYFNEVDFDGERARMDFRSARIAGTSYLDEVQWRATTLDLRGARTSGLSDKRPDSWPKSRWGKWFKCAFSPTPEIDCWPQKGNLILDGFTYERFVDGIRPKDSDTVTLSKGGLRRLSGIALFPLNWILSLRRSSSRRHSDYRESQVDTSFEFRRAWLDLRFADAKEKRLRFRPQPHTQCAKVLQVAGHSRDARFIRHDREKLWTRSKETSLWSWPFWGVFNLLAGYGFRPFRAISWAFAIWLAAIPFYHVAHDTGGMFPDNPLILERYKESCNTDKMDGDPIRDKLASNTGSYPGYEAFNSAIYSLDAFVPLMEFGQTSKWRPWGQLSEGVQCFDKKGGVGLFFVSGSWSEVVRPAIHWLILHGWLPWVYWFQVLFGWVLSTVVVTGLTGLLQRGERD